LADSEQARLSQAVKYISLIVFAALIVPIVRVWILNWPHTAGILIGEAAAVAAAFLLNRMGATQRAAIVLVFSALACAMVLLWNSEQGLHDEAVFLVPAVLVFAGLLLSWRQYCVFAVVTILDVGIVGVAEVHGLTASRRVAGANYEWLFNVDLILVVTATATGLMARHLRAYADEARRRTAALLESEERYREFVNNAPIGIYRTTLDGRMELVNSTLAKMLGFDSVEDLKSRDLESESYEPRADRTKFKQTIEEQGEIRGHEERWMRRDGTPIHIRESAKGVRGQDGKIQYYDGVVEDITERKVVEDALRHEQAFTERVIDAIPGIFFVFDRHGRYVRWNKAHETLFGVPRERIPEIEALSRIHADDRARVAATIEQVFETGAGEVEARGLRGEGPESLYFFLTGRRIDIDGAPYVVGFGIDTTAHREAEAARTQLEEQLLQSQRLDSLGRLAGGIAHDFNNLLTVINGYCDLLLLCREHDAATLRRHLEVIRQAGERATALTQQLLAFSRKQVAQPHPVSINDLVAEVVELSRRLIGENIELVVEPDPGAGQVLADSGQLHQMLMNLVINARDAMSEGGRLIIRTRAVDLGPERAAQLDIAPGDSIRITVSDTGYGMDEHVRAHLFEPFFTTKPAGKGTGLGLSTVYGIVHACQGTITVDSRPGAGSTFEIHLPQFCAEPSPGESETDQHAVVRGASTVLVVEDEPAVRQFAVEVLAGSGHRMLQAANAEEALLESTRYSLPIDLLLTDMVMPGINGLDLAGRIRAIHPETRVLLVSGYSEVLTAEGKLEAGFHYLQKPYTPESLTRTVERILS
jgi:PAS domain S-box-containing protein